MNLEQIEEQTPFFLEGVTRGRIEGLRVAVADLCAVLGIELTEARRAMLASLGLSDLETLRVALKSTRAWPLVPAAVVVVRHRDIGRTPRTADAPRRPPRDVARRGEDRRPRGRRALPRRRRRTSRASAEGRRRHGNARRPRGRRSSGRGVGVS